MDSDGRVLPPEKAATVRRELARIVASTPFHGSKRAQECLSFLVTCALEQKTDRLKERIIGNEVFGREPDYDTGADAVVRVCVNEIRKKLAQHYVATADSEVVIELGRGSYIPKFQWKAPAQLAAPQAGSAPQGRSRTWRTSIAAALVCCAILAAGIIFKTRFTAPKSAVERFWEPVLQSPLPVVLCVGNSVVYVLSDRLHERFLNAHPGIQQRGTYTVTLEGLIPAGDIIPSPSGYVASTDAVAGALIAGALARMGKSFQIRTGSDFSYTDLHGSPAVLVGFANPVHREVTRGLRFTPLHVNRRRRVVQDHVSPERSFEVDDISPDGRAELDYGIISRLINAETGQPVIQAGGVATFGTRAACEFIVDPASIEMATAQLPPGWERKNVQIVIRVRVLGNTTTKPQVVAVHTW